MLRYTILFVLFALHILVPSTTAITDETVTQILERFTYVDHVKNGLVWIERDEFTSLEDYHPACMYSVEMFPPPYDGTPVPLTRESFVEANTKKIVVKAGCFADYVHQQRIQDRKNRRVKVVRLASGYYEVPSIWDANIRNIDSIILPLYVETCKVLFAIVVYSGTAIALTLRFCYYAVEWFCMKLWGVYNVIDFICQLVWAAFLECIYTLEHL